MESSIICCRAPVNIASIRVKDYRLQLRRPVNWQIWSTAGLHRCGILRTYSRTKSVCCHALLLEDEAVRPESKFYPSDKKLDCCLCGRRHVLAAISCALTANLKDTVQAEQDPKDVLVAIHPPRARWYEEIYAIQMAQGMKGYETQMASIKAQLFKSLDNDAKKLLEIGIGTGPNIRYYANKPKVSVIGVDPNQQMEKYARASASKAGLEESQFEFTQGVGEALPVASSSADAVICTLVLCSVVNVAATLKEVKRVLRPGGCFLFVEHVAAPAGSSLRFWQDILDPVQQAVADGCHLTRNTLGSIEAAGFTSVNAKHIEVPGLSLLSPHAVGVAYV